VIQIFCDLRVLAGDQTLKLSQPGIEVFVRKRTYAARLNILGIFLGDSFLRFLLNGDVFDVLHSFISLRHLARIEVEKLVAYRGNIAILASTPQSSLIGIGHSIKHPQLYELSGRTAPVLQLLASDLQKVN